MDWLNSGGWVLVICVVVGALGLLGGVRRWFGFMQGIGNILVLLFFLALTWFAFSIRDWPLMIVSGGMAMLSGFYGGRHDALRAGNPRAAKAEDNEAYHSPARELIAVATPLMILAVIGMVVLAVGQFSGQIDVIGALNSPVGR